jgi:DNA adenine methylase
LTYVEVFGGSAAVLLAKEPVGVEVYNDIDGQLVNLFRVLREPVLFKRFTEHSKARSTHEPSLNWAKHKSDDSVESALRFIVRQR